MNIKQMPSEEKPREKLLREGSDRLSTTEILAILINSGTKEISALEIAAQLLSIDKRGVRFLAECSPEELGRIK